MTTGHQPQEPEKAASSELRTFLDRIRAGDEQAAAIYSPDTRPRCARRSTTAPQAATLSVRFAGLPPERLGQLLHAIAGGP